MKKFTVFSLILIVCLAISGCTKSVNSSETNPYQSKITELRNEAAKLNVDKSLLPKDNYEIVENCNTLLKEIFKEKGSQNLSSKDILGDSDILYLKVLSEENLGEARIKYLEFGASKTLEGATIHLYAQFIRGKEAPELQDIDSLNENSSNKYTVVSCKQSLLNGSYYTKLISKVNGPENNYLKLTGYKYADNKLIPYFMIADSPKAADWTVIKDTASSTSYITYKGADSYEVQDTGASITIKALDKDKNILGTFQLEFNKTLYISK